MTAERWVEFAHDHTSIDVVVVTRRQPFNTVDHIEYLTPKQARDRAADLIRRADEIDASNAS